jgi:hypothetical protein
MPVAEAERRSMAYAPAVPRKAVLFALLSIAAVGGAGCDPEAPGASGEITLASGLDETVFTTLALRTFANASGPYDPSQPIPADADRGDRPLTAVTFPYHYDVGGGIGTSKFQSWQMVAWLSRRTLEQLRDAVRSDSGDPFCSVAYRAIPCGIGVGGYCGVASGVDCVLQPGVIASP